jgi:hypothetical protein
MTATLAPPDRSLRQRLAALERANEIRSRRAAWKRDVKAGRCRVGVVLAVTPWWMESMRVLDVLLSVPGVGHVKATRWLKLAGVSSRRSVGGLSLRQRAELVGLLGERA